MTKEHSACQRMVEALRSVAVSDPFQGNLKANIYGSYRIIAYTEVLSNLQVYRRREFQMQSIAVAHPGQSWRRYGW